MSADHSDEDPIDQVLALIDELGAPDQMTKEEYIEFCESIVSDCEMRAAAMREEIDAEPEE